MRSGSCSRRTTPTLPLASRYWAAVGPGEQSARKMTPVIERRPMCVIEAPNATFGDDNRAIQLTQDAQQCAERSRCPEPISKSKSDNPRRRHLIGETLGILESAICTAPAPN